MDRDDALAEQQRYYAGEDPERIIKAGRLVLQVSDPLDVDFRDTANGFVGLRRYVIYAVFAAAVGQEKWEFTADPSPKGVRAFLTVSEAGKVSGGYSSTPYEEKMASIALYRLFWSRVDYLLGRRAEWVTCTEATAELVKTNTNSSAALAGLCGPTSDGRDAPAPEQFPPMPKPPAAKPKS